MAGGSESNEDEIWNYKSVKKLKNTKVCQQSTGCGEKINFTSLKKSFPSKKNKNFNKTSSSSNQKIKVSDILASEIGTGDQESLKGTDKEYEKKQDHSIHVIDVDLLNNEDDCIETKSNHTKEEVTFTRSITVTKQRNCKQKCRNKPLKKKSISPRKPVNKQDLSPGKKAFSPKKKDLSVSPKKSLSSSQNSNSSSKSDISIKCHSIEEYFNSSSQNLKRKSSESVSNEALGVVEEVATKKIKCKNEQKEDSIHIDSDCPDDKDVTRSSNVEPGTQTQNTGTTFLADDTLVPYIDVDIIIDSSHDKEEKFLSCDISNSADPNHIVNEPDLCVDEMGGFLTTDLCVDEMGGFLTPDLCVDEMGGFLTESDLDLLSAIDKGETERTNVSQKYFEENDQESLLIVAEDSKNNLNSCLSSEGIVHDSVFGAKPNNTALAKQTSLYSFFKPKFGLKEKSQSISSDSSKKNQSLFGSIKSRPDLHYGKKNCDTTVNKPSSSCVISSSKLGAENAPTKNDAKKVCPFYKKIPGTAITVDAFRYGVIPGCHAYILTHFHYDHYGGLTKKFAQPIYCSKVTGNLVQSRLGVDNKWINQLPMWQPCQVAGVTLTFMEANHCPGAVIVLFELQDGRKILHTGDFRASAEMEQYKMLQNVSISELYLDTTYCDPSYAFPAQSEVIDFVVSLVLNYVTENSNPLIVCGSYTIGKERIFHAIAKILDTKICVMNDKKKVLDCLDDIDLKSRITLDWSKGQVHVLPMGKLNQKALFEHHSKHPQFESIIALEPTGWTHQNKVDSLQNLRPKWSKNNVTLYGVPYSEHSSFLELKRFVQFLKPKKILPTVNNGNPSSRLKMEEIFKQWQQ